MVDSEIKQTLKVFKNYRIETSMKEYISEKAPKTFRYGVKNTLSKRILIILFILSLNIQVSICDNPVITIKIKKDKIL